MENPGVMIAHLVSILVVLAFVVGFFVSNIALRKERMKVAELEAELHELKSAR